MTKDEIYKQIQSYEEKMNSVPEKYKGFWRNQIKRLKKRLYGS